MERKVEPPKWFYEKPELLPGQYFYIESFDQLTTCRFISQGSVGRIPWTAIQKYSEVHEMDYEEYRLFSHVIGRLDQYYVEWVYENMKKDPGDGDA